jgi:hypothetical protein
MAKKLIGILIDEDLRKKVKVKCAQQSITITGLILKLLAEWVNKK